MIKYKLSKEIPEVYPQLREYFGVRFEDVLIAYGDTIHCVNDSLPEHCIAHELVHLEQQQTMGVKEWWDKYLIDPTFRLEQEIPAYRAQIAYLKEHTELMPRDERRQWIKKLKNDLCGSMYGNLITSADADRLLS